jgi:transposase
MPFAALDLHKREIEACVMDDQGKITHRQRLPTTSDALVAFAKRHLSRKHKVAMEATFNTWAVADVLMPHVESLTISNPPLTRAIAQAKIKTDKIDSAVLAHLLRLDYLPTVWQPDPHTRRLRSETTERATLTQDRTRLKNRMHGLRGPASAPVDDAARRRMRHRAGTQSRPRRYRSLPPIRSRHEAQQGWSW